MPSHDEADLKMIDGSKKPKVQPVNALAFVSMKVSSIMMHTAAMTAAMNADDMSLTRKFSDVQNAYCITLKFKEIGRSKEKFVQKMQMEWQAQCRP